MFNFLPFYASVYINYYCSFGDLVDHGIMFELSTNVLNFQAFKWREVRFVV